MNSRGLDKRLLPFTLEYISLHFLCVVIKSILKYYLERGSRELVSLFSKKLVSLLSPFWLLNRKSSEWRSLIPLPPPFFIFLFPFLFSSATKSGFGTPPQHTCPLSITSGLLHTNRHPLLLGVHSMYRLGARVACTTSISTSFWATRLLVVFPNAPVIALHSWFSLLALEICRSYCRLY